jgi:hypothetical protein
MTRLPVLPRTLFVVLSIVLSASATRVQEAAILDAEVALKSAAPKKVSATSSLEGQEDNFWAGAEA